MRNQNKKKRQDTGFTLIELLAVITIMGILMMVAIPSISSTIKNSRKDTFATTAGELISAVKNAYNSDNLKCGSSGNEKSAIALDGTLYVVFGMSGVTNNQDITTLLESGNKSPFGDADYSGYVKLTKSGEKVTYSIALADSSKNRLENGTQCDFPTSSLDKEIVKASDDTTNTCIADKLKTTITAVSTDYVCRIVS